MKLADRYILSELTPPFFLASGGFILFMTANIVFLLVDQIVKKQVPVLAVIEMLFLRLPAILVLTFPVAMLFASLLGLARLASDNEIMAMRTGGIPFPRLAMPAIVLSLVLVLLTFVTNEKIAPWATHKSEEIVRRILLRQSLPPVEPNVFIRGPKNTVFYIGGIDRASQMLYRVMIFEEPGNGYPRMTVAGRARYDGRRFYLYDGSIHQYGPTGMTQYESSFHEMIIPVMIDPERIAPGQKSPFEMNLRELRAQIDLLKKSGIATQSLATDYHFKLSLPFGCLVAGLIGVPLGVRHSRGGKIIGVALAVSLLFAYYCLFSIFRSLGILGLLPSWLAAWIPNALLGGIGLLFLWSEEKVR